LFAESRLTTTVDVAFVPVRVVPPSLEVHVESNEVMETPLFEPGVMDTEAVPTDGTDTLAIVGAFGGAAGLTAADVDEELPVPAKFVAVTPKQ
jgi:hypothetical protein